MGSTSSSNQIYSRWNANIISRYQRIRQMNSRWEVSQIPNIIQNNSEFVWTQLAGYEAALPERFFFISWPATWNLISSQTPWPPGHKCMKYSRIRLKLKHIWSTGRQFPPGTRGLLWLPFGALLLLIKLFFINATPTFCLVKKWGKIKHTKLNCPTEFNLIMETVIIKNIETRSKLIKFCMI